MPAKLAATSPGTSSPKLELRSLDTLWFQVGGTLCNLCVHPLLRHRALRRTDTHELMALAEKFAPYLEEAAALGVQGVLLHRRRAIPEPRDGGDPGCDPATTVRRPS